MSAILRASGVTFDVDSFTKNSPFVIDRLYRCGDPVRPTVAPDGRKLKRSGFSVIVSEVGFDDCKLQFKEAFLFMGQNADELKRLAEFPGLQSLCIDFGANIYPPGWCSFRFPHQLLLMAGRLKVDLELSVYPTEREEGSVGEQMRSELAEAYEEFVGQNAKAGKPDDSKQPAPAPRRNESLDRNP